MIKFREKQFSMLGSVIKGASMGASFGTLASGGLKYGTEFGKSSKDSKIIGDAKSGFNKTLELNKKNPFLIVGATALIGGALGALAESIGFVDKKISRLGTNRRIMDSTISDLKKIGFKKEQDYTQDPKMATLLKTRVCIVVSRSSDDLKVLINTARDPKLKEITDEIIQNLPALSVKTEKQSDRFNELNISTISSNGDPGFISSIAEKFIRRGFPVYLVEVG